MAMMVAATDKAAAVSSARIGRMTADMVLLQCRWGISLSTSGADGGSDPASK
jgi:hypothetical protein